MDMPLIAVTDTSGNAVDIGAVHERYQLPLCKKNNRQTTTKSEHSLGSHL